MLSEAKQTARTLLTEFGNEGIEYVANRIVEKEFLVQTQLDEAIEEAQEIGSRQLCFEFYKEK